MLSLNTQTEIFDDRSAGKRLIPEVLYQSFPSCTVFFLFTASLTNYLFAQTEGQWGGDFAIASDIGAVNMTALDGAGGGWAAAAITLLSGCCNMILGHISSGFQPPLPSNDMKNLRCVSFGSLNVICVYHCDLWISYACIILICNVIYMYPFVCECYNYIDVSLWYANAIWMYYFIYECHITCVFCIPFTYVLLGNKYLFIVIVIVIVITGVS